MSLYIDVKYLNQIGTRLPLFKRKGEYLYNCRCPVCGDSQRKRNRARGYFYRHSNDLFFKCHNCDVSQHFGTFLKTFDPGLYREYALERYSNGENRRPHAQPEFEFAPPVFEPRPERNLLDALLTRVSDCDPDSEVRRFCQQRRLPESALDQLYLVESAHDLEGLNARYQGTIPGREPRLVIPFRDRSGRLVGVTARGLRGEALRYLTVRINEDAPLVFGLDVFDETRAGYIVEGPLDSLFLPNALAVGGTGFNKLESLGLDLSRCTVVIDNQPRNSEVCRVYERVIDAGHRIMIWPSWIVTKDINDLVSNGTAPELVPGIIDSNSYVGAAARLKFNLWRKV